MPRATAKPAKLSQIQAAIKILGQSREPMTCGELVAAMTKRKLWSSPAGKTPDRTLYASILRDLRKGKASRFQQTGRGQFTLAKQR